MIKLDINKDFDTLLRFSDIVMPSIFKNNLRLKTEKLSYMEAQQKIEYSYSENVV